VGVGVPHLLPVDDPLVAVLHGPGLQPGEVGAGLGLAQQLRAQQVAPVDRGQEAPLEDLATVDELMLQKSRASFREEVERALLLGVDYLVVHPGSSRGACEADGIGLCAASLQIACKGLRFGKLRILLENTAGQGDCIGHRFEHLEAIMSVCPKLPLGVCLDTAHAFTAGYDIREEDGLEALLQRVQKTVKTKNVRAIHFNDSRVPYNSRVDRHWHIGEGHIGADALRRVARHPKLKHAAFILETPYDDPLADLKNLEMLRSFVTTD